MSRLTRAATLLLAVGLLFLAGCQKFKYEKDYECEPDLPKFITIDGFRSDTRVTVTVTAEDPVFVALIVEAQYEEIKGIPANKTMSATVAALWEKIALTATREPAKDVTLTTTFPAKKDVRICILLPAKAPPARTANTKVHLKVVSE